MTNKTGFVQFGKEIRTSISRGCYGLLHRIIQLFLYTRFESITGKGAKAEINNETWLAGNKNLMIENTIQMDEHLIIAAERWAKEAKTVIWFSDNKKAIAVIAIADKIKTSSEEAIRQLKQLGIEVYMLTGDNEATAKAVAQKAGIANYKAEALPHQKAEFVKTTSVRRQNSGHGWRWH